MPLYETYLTIKQAATRLYTYLPKDNTAAVDGLLSTALTESGRIPPELLNVENSNNL